MSHSGTSLISSDHGHDARRHFSGLLVGVDLDVRAFDLSELTDLDVLTEQSGRLFDGFLHGGFAGSGCQHFVHGSSFGLDGILENAVSEFHELRGLGHEVGLGIQFDGVTGLTIGGLHDLGGDGAFLSLTAFALTSGLNALGTDDLLGASHVTLSLGQSLLNIHHAGAGFLAHLLDQSCSDCCH